MTTRKPHKDIDTFLAKLAEYWKFHNDLSFFQMLREIPYDKTFRQYYILDEQLEKALDKVLESQREYLKYKAATTKNPYKPG